mmetsp:Transcript_13033/g.28351  ORF Transcript_13033/g.28351 Transcript_13033/m.28351 type:complete len:138 (-) Transcript_13033:95-508(-)
MGATKVRAGSLRLLCIESLFSSIARITMTRNREPLVPGNTWILLHPELRDETSDPVRKDTVPSENGYDKKILSSAFKRSSARGFLLSTRHRASQGDHIITIYNVDEYSNTVEPLPNARTSGSVKIFALLSRWMQGLA